MDAFKKADQFRFIWQELQQNGDLSVQVLDQSSPNPAAKAGLMLRKSVDPVSPYYGVFVTPGKGVQVQYSSDYNQPPVVLASIRMRSPIYLKLTRDVTRFEAYTSADGQTWTLIPHSPVTVDRLAGSLMAGMAVTSQDESRLNAATFNNLNCILRGTD
jgi:hypothetical protein